MSSHHYIRFAANPPCTDALTLRKTIQDALLQSFGLTSANTYVDVLWVADDGTEVVARLNTVDATKVMAAVTAYTGSPNLSLVKESSFLPALLRANKTSLP